MLGSYLGADARRLNVRVFHRLFGTTDFHSHLRLHWIDSYRNIGRSMVCELGCGAGVNLIELALRSKTIVAIGYDGDENAVNAGRKTIKKLDIEDRVFLRACDLTTTFPEEIFQADYILLIDVLEHLPAPEAFAERLKSALKPNARVLISVPTPLYPKMFGRRFHEDIGHLHDGFFLEDIDRMFAGLRQIRYRYSTGPLSWPGVWLYYRLPTIGTHTTLRRRANRLLDMFRTWGSLPFRFFDYWNARSLSCSLFVEYTKP